MEKSEENGKLNGMIEKWGAKSAMLLLLLCVFVYQQDRGQAAADNKALAARTAANERAIGRLQEGKASREELKAAMDSISRDNQRSRDDIKEIVSTLKNDLIQRMDLLTNKR
jgi:hypothetical protein